MVKSNLRLDKAVAARNLGRLILKYRTINDLSQKDFGELLSKKVTHASVNRWEKGKQLPDRDNLENLARILDKSFEELCSLIEDSQLDVDKVDVPQPLKPDKHHLKLLKQGVKVWNRWREKHPDTIPQLAGLDLVHWSLDGINLSRADLRKAYIGSSSSRNANFERANLSEAQLDTVCFDNSRFNDADLSQSSLRNCNLNDVWLKRVNFTQVYISVGKFGCSCLYQSCFDSAQLTHVDLRNANLNQTSWNQASLGAVNILGASFEGVDWQDVESRDIYMESENYRIQVENLADAPLVYIEQHNRLLLERYIQERKIKQEVKAIVDELLNRYGSRASKKNQDLNKELFGDGKSTFGGYIGPSEGSIFCSCMISDSHHLNEEGEQIRLQYLVIDELNSVCAGYIVRNNDTLGSINHDKGILKYHGRDVKTIIEIKNGIASYDLHSLDLKDLKKVKTLITEQQTEQILKFLTIAKKLFRALHDTFYQDRKYTLERQEDDFVLKKTHSKDNPIMDINYRDDVPTIRRSALETKHFSHFHKVLKKLGNVNDSFDT